MKLFTSCMGSNSSRLPKSDSDKPDRVPCSSGRPHRFSKVHQGGVNCLARSGASHAVVTGGADGNATIFNFKTGKVCQYLRHDGKAVTALGSCSAGVVTGCRDTNVRLWGSVGNNVTLFPGHSLVVTAVVVSADSARILSGSRDNQIIAWDVTTAKTLFSITESRNLITAMQLVPGENVLVQTGEDQRVRLWDTRNLQLIHVFPRKNNIQTCCDVSGDGNTIVSGSNGFNGSGCELTLWDMRNRCKLRELRGHDEWVNCVRFLGDAPGRFIASGAKDSVVKLWDLNRQHNSCVIEKRLPGMGSINDCVSYSDGNLMCATQNGCVLLTISDDFDIVETVCF